MPYLQLFYHLVWSTKLKQPLLDGKAERFVHQELRRKALDLDARVFAVNGFIDHVHVVASIPPKLAVADFVGRIKGASSALANKAGICNQHFSWQREYGAFTLDRKRLPSHIAYVDAQKDHHNRKTAIRGLEPRDDDMFFVLEDKALYIVEDPKWRQEMEP